MSLVELLPAHPSGTYNKDFNTAARDQAGKMEREEDNPRGVI